jgi:hypothetical protein
MVFADADDSHLALELVATQPIGIDFRDLRLMMMTCTAVRDAIKLGPINIRTSVERRIENADVSLLVHMLQHVGQVVLSLRLDQQPTSMWLTPLSYDFKHGSVQAADAAMKQVEAIRASMPHPTTCLLRHYVYGRAAHVLSHSRSMAGTLTAATTRATNDPSCTS